MANPDEYADDLQRFNLEITPLLLEFKEKLDGWFVTAKPIYQHNLTYFCESIDTAMFSTPAIACHMIDEIKKLPDAGRFRRPSDKIAGANAWRAVLDEIRQKKPTLSFYTNVKPDTNNHI